MRSNLYCTTVSKEYVMDARISNLAQIASLRRYHLMGGAQDGLEVIDCDNGKLRFLVNVSKACDIMQLYHEGQNVSFISKNGFTKREIPFLNRFEGGMLYTCGLDNAGRREGYEMHGSFHNTPAEILRAECNEGGIVIEALIRNSALFGQSLVMKRRITSAIGDTHLVLEDTLYNEGYADAEYCLLYHINVGYPMLDEGARILTDATEFYARAPFAVENAATRYEMSDAIPNQPECCYYLTMKEPKATLVNEKLGKAFTLSYSADTLPFFLEWKSMASKDYALGLEPCTTMLDSAFTYKTVAPGGSVAFRVDICVDTI